MIQQLIDTATILPLMTAADKTGALDEVLTAAQSSSAFPKKETDQIRQALLEREDRGSTGIGNGVAVPHVKSDAVKKLGLVVARSEAGVEFQAIDGRPVHIFFLLVSPADKAEDHLECLKWIAGLARNADFRRFMMQVDTEDGIRDLLREMSGTVQG